MPLMPPAPPPSKRDPRVGDVEEEGEEVVRVQAAVPAYVAIEVYDGQPTSCWVFTNLDAVKEFMTRYNLQSENILDHLMVLEVPVGLMEFDQDPDGFPIPGTSRAMILRGHTYDGDWIDQFFSGSK